MVRIDYLRAVAGRIVGIADPAEEFINNGHELAAAIVFPSLFPVLAGGLEQTAGRIIGIAFTCAVGIGDLREVVALVVGIAHYCPIRLLFLADVADAVIADGGCLAEGIDGLDQAIAFVIDIVQRIGIGIDQPDQVADRVVLGAGHRPQGIGFSNRAAKGVIGNCGGVAVGIPGRESVALAIVGKKGLPVAGEGQAADQPVTAVIGHLHTGAVRIAGLYLVLLTVIGRAQAVAEWIGDADYIAAFAVLEVQQTWQCTRYHRSTRQQPELCL